MSYMNSYVSTQMVLDKGAINMPWGKDSLFKNGAKKIGFLCA